MLFFLYLNEFDLRCELEEYMFGRSRGAGRVQTAQMNLTVQPPTTRISVKLCKFSCKEAQADNHCSGCV